MLLIVAAHKSSHMSLKPRIRSRFLLSEGQQTMVLRVDGFAKGEDGVLVVQTAREGQEGIENDLFAQDCS